MKRWKTECKRVVLALGVILTAAMVDVPPLTVSAAVAAGDSFEVADEYCSYTYQVNEDGESVTLTDYEGVPSSAYTFNATSAKVAYDGKEYTITAIGDGAFSGCAYLESITILSGVTTIGDSAFSKCDNLKSVTISSVKEIGTSAFADCTNLETLTVYNTNLQTIGDSAFRECSNLKSAKLSDGVTTIGVSAFAYSGLTGIVLPDSLNTIGNSAFYYCDGLEGTLTIPGNVRTIGEGTFKECSGLDSLVLGIGVNTIGNSAFYNCTGLSGRLSIPQGITTIGANAFYNCSGLTGTLEIPDSVSTIGDYAFNNSKFNGTLVIPDSVRTVGGCAFVTNSLLESVIIESSDTTFGSLVFHQCYKLNRISFADGEAPKNMETDAFSNSRLYQLTIENGLGDGMYAKDEKVEISPTIPEGYIFGPGRWMIPTATI